MNLEQLEHRLQIHQAFSASIRSALARLWHRPLTEAEGAVVDSGTLCCSFMGLEALDSKLAHATAASVGDGEYGHLKDTVSRSHPEVLRALAQVATRWGVVLGGHEGGNLLAVEARLVEDLRQASTRP